jgi:hypothetical protein
MSDKAAYIASIVEEFGLPLALVQQATDLADVAADKAFDVAKAHIELHHERDVRQLALGILIDLLHHQTAQKRDAAAMLISLIAVDHRSANNA